MDNIHQRSKALKVRLHDIRFVTLSSNRIVFPIFHVRLKKRVLTLHDFRVKETNDRKQKLQHEESLIAKTSATNNQ